MGDDRRKKECKFFWQHVLSSLLISAPRWRPIEKGEMKRVIVEQGHRSSAFEIGETKLRIFCKGKCELIVHVSATLVATLPSLFVFLPLSLSLSRSAPLAQYTKCLCAWYNKMTVKKVGGLFLSSYVWHIFLHIQAVARYNGSNTQTINATDAELILNGRPGSRFGMAFSILGDLDKDGYQGKSPGNLCWLTSAMWHSECDLENQNGTLHIGAPSSICIQYPPSASGY